MALVDSADHAVKGKPGEYLIPLSYAPHNHRWQVGRYIGMGKLNVTFESRETDQHPGKKGMYAVLQVDKIAEAYMRLECVTNAPRPKDRPEMIKSISVEVLGRA